MIWPNIGKYNEAIQNPHHNLGDKELRAGHVATKTWGMPLTWSGQFAVVYKIDCPGTGKTWALKCFIQHIPNLQQRYQALAEHLSNVECDYTVPFSYLERGIRVGGKWYPAVKMQWVEGSQLDEFLEQNLDNKAALHWLLKTWLNLAERLAACEIAHGDLQHRNVLIQDGSGRRQLMLVDYDGMCVPKLVGLRPQEEGHKAFQHPQPLQEGTYGLDVDRFSHLVIYTTLYCLRIGGKQLWSTFHNEENLLFTENDFKEPARSELFRQLWQLDDDDATALVGRLALACVRPVECVPALWEVVTAHGIRPMAPRDHLEVESLLNRRRSGATDSLPGSGLARAVRSAFPNDKIVLKEGLYRIPHSLKVDKPLKIIGQGKEKTLILWEGQGPAIIYSGQGRLVLRELAVECRGEKVGPVFKASQGVLAIEECAFRGAKVAPAILLTGNVRGRIRNCLVEKNFGSGIHLEARGMVALEDNVCQSNGKCGIAYFSCSGGVARNNTCRENKQYGIYVGDEARPRLEKNACEGNDWCGLGYCGSSSGTASNNVCRKNKKNGVYIGGRAAPILMYNTCETNEGSGIAYFGSSGGTARNNTCRENKKNGVYVGDQARPTIEKNVCRRNECSGIAYFGSSGGTASNNTCLENKLQGIYVGELAAPMLDQSACEPTHQWAAETPAFGQNYEESYVASYVAIGGGKDAAIGAAKVGASGGAVLGAIGWAIAWATGEVPDKGVFGLIVGAMLGAMLGAIGFAVGGATDAAIVPLSRAAVGGMIRGATYGAIVFTIGGAILGAVVGASGGVIGRAIVAAIGGAVVGAIYGAINGAINASHSK